MKKESKNSKKGENVRRYDAKTILYNMAFDMKRMLDDGQDIKKVAEYVQNKMEFLQNPPVGNKVNWS